MYEETGFSQNQQSEGSSSSFSKGGGVGTPTPYKPSHGEIIRARAHIVHSLKNGLLTRLEATGSIDRAKFEAEFGPVTQKHVSCINQHILNAGLQFEVLPKDGSKSRTIYCSRLVASQPES